MRKVPFTPPSEAPVQSTNVGSSPTVRKKRVREEGSLKREVKINMDKIANGLRA